MLGASDADPKAFFEETETKIKTGQMPVGRLAKSETLNQAPAKYLKAVEESKKPRRAALEVALRMDPVPGMGERITYFVGPKEKGKTAMWQRAFAVGEYDPIECPYDVGTYTKKLKEWMDKYGELLALAG